MAHTTTSGRAHGGKLLDGWSPSSQSEAQLLQHLAAYDVSQARLLLRLAAQACQALRVRWEASQNHVTIVSPWEVSLGPQPLLLLVRCAVATVKTLLPLLLTASHPSLVNGCCLHHPMHMYCHGHHTAAPDHEAYMLFGSLACRSWNLEVPYT